MKKRIMAVFLAFFTLIATIMYPTLGTYAKTDTSEYRGLDAQYHTQNEIRQYYKEHPIRNMEAEFVTEPSVTVPYAMGELTEETKQDALNKLNLYRYIAGVPTVTITDKAQNYAQAAALVCAINRTLSHTAGRPDEMTDDLYALALYGTGNSNLGTAGNKLNNFLFGYMTEINGSPNYGHRRQLLDYYNTETGFGLAKSISGTYYSATYVDANLKEDKIISYPGQNQPLEFFGSGYAWTVIVPEAVDATTVHVKITDTNRGTEWNFSTNDANLRIADSNSSACLIFAPEVDYRAGDCYKVEITGISKPISYEVNMFLVDDPVPLESIKEEVMGYYVYPGHNNTYCSVNYVPENASNKIVTWSSSDPDVAEPVWAGTGICTINAKKTGTAIFTAISEDGGYTAEITITVLPIAETVELDKTDVTIGVGQSFELSGTVLPKEAKDITHYRNNYDKNIISVEQTQYVNKIMVTGKAIGETSITAYASSNSNATAICNIHVVEPVYTEKLSFDEADIELMCGDVQQIDPIVKPDNITCRSLKWSSSNNNVASVDDGKITAKGLGTAIITAKALDGSEKEAQYTVSVYSKYAKPTAPLLDSATSTTIVLKNAFNYEYEYSMDLENWQESRTFENLEPEHEYTFYIRRKASGYTKASDPSDGLTVKTMSVLYDTCTHPNKVIKDQKPATCTEYGYTGTTYCEDCGRTLAVGNTTTTWHTYIKRVTKEATEASEGIMTYTCLMCGDSYTEPIPKLQSGDKPNPQPPTVTKRNISKATVTLSSNTCNYNGKQQKPTVKAVKLDQAVLKPNVDYTVKYTNNVNMGKATVTITGQGLYTGIISKSFSITAKKGSSFTINGLTYKITGSSSVSFIGLKNNNTTKAVIPKTVKIGGKVFKVTSVAKNALKKTKVVSVSIGANVTSIGISAFEGCTRLSKVTVGNNVASIGSNAFKNCKKLSSITIKSSKLKSVGKNALKGIKSTAKIKVPTKKLKLYKKLLAGKGQSRTVKIVK